MTREDARARPPSAARPDIEQQAGRGHRHEQRRATGGEERQGQAGDREESGHATGVDDRLHTEPGGDAAGEKHAEPIGCRQGGLDAEPHEEGETAEHGERADEAELVGDDGEDEVAVRQREIAELAVAGADAGSGQPAVGDRQEALVGLEGQVVPMAGDVEEGGEPVDPPLAGDDEPERRRRRHQRRPDHRREWHATDERDGEDDRRHHDGRSEIGLGEAGAGRESSEQHQRFEAAAHVGKVVLAPYEEIGGEHNDGELEELGGLHRELAEGDPRPRIVERDANR